MGVRMQVGTHTCPGKRVNARGQLAGVAALLQPWPEGKMKVVRLGAKYFYPLRHLTSPCCVVLEYKSSFIL